MDINTFDAISVENIFEENRYGLRISRTLSDFLSKDPSVEIAMRLRHSGQVDYYWIRPNNVPLSADEHFLRFVESYT